MQPSRADFGVTHLQRMLQDRYLNPMYNRRNPGKYKRCAGAGRSRSSNAWGEMRVSWKDFMKMQGFTRGGNQALKSSCGTRAAFTLPIQPKVQSFGPK